MIEGPSIGVVGEGEVAEEVHRVGELPFHGELCGVDQLHGLAGIDGLELGVVKDDEGLLAKGGGAVAGGARGETEVGLLQTEEAGVLPFAEAPSVRLVGGLPPASPGDRIDRYVPV